MTERGAPSGSGRGQESEGGPASRLFVGLGVLAGLVLVGVLVTVGLGSGGSEGGAERPAARVGVSVERGTLAFSPPELRVPMGGVGVFRNDDAVEHTFTADGGLFDSGPVAPGSSFSFSFPATGELTYRCEIHPAMKGRVVVEAEG